ncbi:Colicin V production protein [Novosphingobium aromaticivorans DSM 12444]|uniref:Colicin V production protein n=1 Tax=Novosphingobium aromaticivorans (strain ATCC 700278 / DSM 12444 / CCUG 56034 / CIP 105152 / NBRC 16084 / F199) TaxID=279238 RepID=Q2G6X8_NOVAD|nr:CvpA family protein [Novosphingobium aromaticivorans]ABD26395.1 Colicin V production protein [Novosphingobium aromaticivorans DSM 12444]SCY78638.1 membrane protein required for colicin V production [Novosphingobium aromaticivorans]
MTGFDYVVLLLVGLGAVGGFFRGFVEEVLSLAAWCLALLAVHYFHEPLTYYLASHLPTETGAGVLAFFLLLLAPYLLTRFIARRMGSASRGSAIGPIDRILGFGFGAVKGFIIVVLGYSIVVFGYDLVWGANGRPQWIVESRTYPFLNAASEELLTLISERREQAADQAREVARRKARAAVLGD